MPATPFNGGFDLLAIPVFFPLVHQINFYLLGSENIVRHLFVFQGDRYSPALALPSPKRPHDEESCR